MANEEDVEGIGSLREELDEMPRPKLTDTAIMWRSYWVQWQEWANRLMDKLKVVKPSNLFSFGRKGSQKMIDANVGALLAEVEELRAARDHDQPMIAAREEFAYKLVDLLDRWVYGDTLTEDLHKLCAETAAVLPPDTRRTRAEQIALALSEMFKAAGRTPP